MWSYQVVAPGFVQRVEVPDDSGELQEGQVRLRVLVAGLCGSDMPRLNGAKGKSSNGDFGGAPVHEVVGEVTESASPLFKASQRVVGTLGPAATLSELVTCSATTIIAVPDGFDDVEAVAIQPVATVLRRGAIPRHPGPQCGRYRRGAVRAFLLSHLEEPGGGKPQCHRPGGAVRDGRSLWSRRVFCHHEPRLAGPSR